MVRKVFNKKNTKLGYDRPYCIMFTDDGLIYCADNRHEGNLFYKGELMELKELLNNTLSYYIRNEITDEYIDAQDKISSEKYLLSMQQDYMDNNRKSNKNPDDLYLIKDTILNKLKIGRSSNVKARLNQLQIANSNKLELLYCIKGKGYLEHQLHAFFKLLHTNGEWFENDGQIIKYFKEEFS